MLFSSFLLTVITLGLHHATAKPACFLDPKPPPYAIPSLGDCLSLYSSLTAAARRQGDVPVTWSRLHRPQPSVILPVHFTKLHEINECEFRVDVLHSWAWDLLPLSRIAQVAGDIVYDCLMGEWTVGDTMVAPRGVVSVMVAKKGVLGVDGKGERGRGMERENGTWVEVGERGEMLLVDGDGRRREYVLER